jgi:hypothetical protein
VLESAYMESDFVLFNELLLYMHSHSSAERGNASSQYTSHCLLPSWTSSYSSSVCLSVLLCGWKDGNFAFIMQTDLSSSRHHQRRSHIFDVVGLIFITRPYGFYMKPCDPWKMLRCTAWKFIFSDFTKRLAYWLNISFGIFASDLDRNCIKCHVFLGFTCSAPSNILSKISAKQASYDECSILSYATKDYYYNNGDK